MSPLLSEVNHNSMRNDVTGRPPLLFTKLHLVIQHYRQGLFALSVWRNI